MPTINAKMMPHNIETEQALLCCILIDNNAACDIMPEIKERDFYTESHKTIFSVMNEIYLSRSPIDFVTVVNNLEKSGKLGSVGGIDYVTSLTFIVPSSVNFKEYVRIIKEYSTLRQLIEASSAVIEKSYSGASKQEALDLAEQSIFAIGQEQSRTDLTPLSEPLQEVMDKFDKIAKDRDSLKGLSTGIHALDKVTNGLQKSDLILIAARPGAGKTSLAMNIVNYAAIHEKAKVALFSLEMPKGQLAQRSLCSVACVSMAKALSGDLTIDDWKLLWNANKQLSETKIYVDDNSLNTPVEILSKCRRLKQKEGLDLIMVDYLQLMNAGSKNASSRQQEVSEISRNMKILAKELDVPVIVLSQLSRAVEQRKDSHRPVLSDLRESGAIEQDADIVMFIYRPDMYEDTINQPNRDISEIIIAKHRNGELKTVKVRWDGATTSFKNLESDENLNSLEETAPQKPANNSSDELLSDSLDSLTEVSPSDLDSDTDNIFS